MKIYSIKPLFQKFLLPVSNLLVKHQVSPTSLNIHALIFSIVGGLALYLSSFNLMLLLFIPVLAFIRIALNALDGMVARETKAKHRQFGEVLNEFVDRLSDCAFFFGLAFATYTNTSLGLISLVFVLLVSYLGIVGKAAGGRRQYIGLMGKADRMFWLSAACIAVALFGITEIMNWFLWFVLVFSIITLLQRFFSIKKELYNFEPQKNFKTKPEWIILK